MSKKTQLLKLLYEINGLREVQNQFLPSTLEFKVLETTLIDLQKCYLETIYNG